MHSVLPKTIETAVSPSSRCQDEEECHEFLEEWWQEAVTADCCLETDLRQNIRPPTLALVKSVFIARQERICSILTIFNKWVNYEQRMRWKTSAQDVVLRRRLTSRAGSLVELKSREVSNYKCPFFLYLNCRCLASCEWPQDDGCMF